MNERDQTRREKLIASGWTEGTIFVGGGPVAGELPIKGTDFVTLENGRSDRVIGFLDQAPA